MKTRKAGNIGFIFFNLNGREEERVCERSQGQVRTENSVLLSWMVDTNLITSASVSTAHGLAQEEVGGELDAKSILLSLMENTKPFNS